MSDDYEALDRFASHALTGLLAGGALEKAGVPHPATLLSSPDIAGTVADAAWLIGQAMAARQESAHQAHAEREASGPGPQVTVF